MNSYIVARAALGTAATLLVAACSVGTANKTASPVTPTAAPTAVAVTASPVASTPGPTTIAGPPAGLLASGDSSVTGFPGSFCWEGTCGDAASMPAKEALPLVDAPTDTLRFSVASASFIGWTASYGADASSMQQLATGGSVEDPDANPSAQPSPLTSAQISSPPAGDWLFQVFVRFADGDATYWWHVKVV